MDYNRTMEKSRNKGEANPFYGKKHSPEALEKIRLTHLGKKRPPRTKEWSERIAASKREKYIGAGNPFYGKHHSEETRRLISQKQKANPKFKRLGAKHWNWQGGISDNHSKLRSENRAKLSEWRKAVYGRDYYTCQNCGGRGSRNQRLNAHHIKSFTKYPELRFEVRNGITLCEKCHNMLLLKHRDSLSLRKLKTRIKNFERQLCQLKLLFPDLPRRQEIPERG